MVDWQLEDLLLLKWASRSSTDEIPGWRSLLPNGKTPLPTLICMFAYWLFIHPY